MRTISYSQACTGSSPVLSALSYSEDATRVSVDIISDGTVSWVICGQQHWEGGRQTEGFLFNKTLREVEDSEIGTDVGLIYEEVLRGLGWHKEEILTIPIADDGLVKILSLDEANYRGLPPHAQQTIKRIRQ